MTLYYSLIDLYCIDLFYSILVACLFNKRTYILTYILTYECVVSLVLKHDL